MRRARRSGLTFGTLQAKNHHRVVLPRSAGRHSVYDGSNRESFEAVPQWLEELENYVPPEVVKIVVENKLDKEYFRQVPTSEGAMFAARTGNPSLIRPRCGMRISPSRQEGLPPPPTPPPLVDCTMPQPRVCRGISICPRCRTRTRREGVCVSSADVFF
ncbi:hypothetical protein BGY98DRAFT_219059 [Russula aff. rugulosa BPL654]|nr:hypothetical protein BGY98DRAFT_219059 [Russula aff. rugulosa BPL654]